MTEDSADRRPSERLTDVRFEGDMPSPPPCFRINEIPSDFLSSDESRQQLLNIISDIEEARNTQQEINKIYNDIVEVYIAEMKGHFRRPLNSPCSRKKMRFTRKEWWDEELTSLFREMQHVEHTYIKSKRNRGHYKDLFNIYKRKQAVFDKVLKRRKRSFQRMQCLRLEEVNSTDPNAFWDYIRRLGPNKKSKIPWECYDDNDVVVHDPERVLKSWRDEFGSLYCSTTPSEMDDEQINFKQYIVNDNKEFERLPLDNSSYIYQPFSRDEISKVVCKSKTNKAPGIDGIVYDVLKNELTTDLLTTFFNLCFETHRVPEIWVQALIYPIPKSSTNDPRVPLNYRGISLLSVISKLYTTALNVRLNNYTETDGYIVNEQNGFRPDRSCLDHIFVLKNVLRIRNELNTQTFCAFIDL